MNARVFKLARTALLIAGVAVLYYGSARLLIALSAPPTGAVIAVWLPSGISVAALIVFGPRAAVGAFLGSLVFELTMGTPPFGAVGMATVNASSELIAYFLIVGRPARRFSLETTRDVVRFLLAAVAGAAVSATLGDIDYVLAGVLSPADFYSSWLTFFGSVVMGIVLITPVLVYARNDRDVLRRWARTAEFAVTLGAVCVAAWLWQGPLVPDAAQESALILAILLLLLSAFRYEPRKMSGAVVGFAVAAIVGAVQSANTASGVPAFASLFALQFMTCSVAAIGFFLSAMVTEQNEAHADLRLAARVFESTNDGIVVTLPDGVIVSVNDAFARLHGVSREKVIGKNPRMFKSGVHDDAFYRSMWESLTETGEWHGEIWDRRSDGSVFPKLLSISAVRGDRGETTHYVGAFSDITNIKDAESRLRQLATHDALTGLANRAVLDDELGKAIARARRHGLKVALIFFDLDHFKNVNDTLGHTVGDDVLAQVASRVSATVRESDIVARQGGDEFIVVVPDLEDMADLDGLASRLLQTIRKPYILGQNEAYLSASLGVSVFPTDGEDAESLVKHADVAMYRAKELGRDRSQFFSADLQEEFHHRVDIETGLRGAMQSDDLFLLYQPQVDLVTGSVEAVEALVRWEAADGLVMMPDEFIPVAEESGLILPVGEWVLQQACRDIAQLRLEGFDLRVAVNFSARQFREADVAGLVHDALQDACLAPSALEVEVTETTLMHDPEEAADRISAIREAGVTVSLDDFGTGYSSLKYVRLFTPDKLKIDRFFTQGAPAHPDARAVVLATLALAESLGTDVIAEGVETAEQLEFLRENGCRFVQGFLFAEPLTMRELTSLLRRVPFDMARYTRPAEVRQG
ncbi:MAG: EAL domain-containing protein [Coriobacteriales bacterium]|nr:EAL domain-containing protein [Coriobacteriales bacterium]